MTKPIEGLYGAARFDNYSTERLDKLCDELGIPNKVDLNTLHVTVLYETNPFPQYQAPAPGIYPMYVTGLEFDVWINRTDGKNALVLKLNCKALHDRRRFLEALGAKWDFETYNPHVTLSYNVDPVILETVSKYDLKKLGSLKLIKEYTEPLDVNWIS